MPSDILEADMSNNETSSGHSSRQLVEPTFESNIKEKELNAEERRYLRRVQWPRLSYKIGGRFRPKKEGVDCVKKEPRSCVLCFKGREIEFRCGRLLYLQFDPSLFAIHECCMYMCKGLSSSENSTLLSEYLLGFQLKDIYEEAWRCRLLRCFVCHGSGASVDCCGKNCHRSYHLPCAIGDGCFMDTNQYLLYCDRHLPSERAERCSGDDEVIVENSPVFSPVSVERNFFCNIVLDNSDHYCGWCNEKVLHTIKINETIVSPCCGLRLAHFACVQQVALRLGVDLRCPVCNGSDEVTHYKAIVSAQGVYVSQVFELSNYLDDYDEDWSCSREAEPNRFCLCPEGKRSFADGQSNEYRPWEAINNCPGCGCVIHRECAGPPWSEYNPNSEEDGDEEVWYCIGCRSLYKTEGSSNIAFRQKNRMAQCCNRKTSSRFKRRPVPKKQQPSIKKRRAALEDISNINEQSVDKSEAAHSVTADEIKSGTDHVKEEIDEVKWFPPKLMKEGDTENDFDQSSRCLVSCSSSPPALTMESDVSKSVADTGEQETSQSQRRSTRSRRNIRQQRSQNLVFSHSSSQPTSSKLSLRGRTVRRPTRLSAIVRTRSITDFFKSV
ncbi:hypothetical protein AB6A40_000369 [Gnathostoma spinigerum]|uniref:PHD-type domain-containing protein n=1 Tax=Gnathostoma spinigerum TaxID=75299 RepID=A0ABD6E2X4_9BILA